MNFLPVRIATLKGKSNLTFNLFIKVSVRYLLYVREGDDLAQERERRLKNFNVKKLFISDDEEVKYQAFLDSCLMNKNINVAEKAALVTENLSGTVEEVFKDPASEESYKMSERATQVLIRAMQENSNLLKSIFENKNTEEDNLALRHSTFTSSLCVKLGMALKYEGKELENLGIAGLFHDIGMVQMNEKDKLLFFKRDEEFTPEDWSIYREHPNLSVNVLSDKSFVNKDIISLVQTHEERLTGQGYPQGITTLDQKNQIVALCAYYSRMINVFKKSHAEVIDNLKITELGAFDLLLVNELVKTLRAEKMNEISHS